MNSKIEVVDYGEKATSARYYIKGLVADSQLEKVVTEKLGVKEKSRAGALKTNEAPYNVLTNLGVAYTIIPKDSGKNESSSNHSPKENANTKEEKSIWWSKDSGESLIYVKKPILKDNADLRKAFKEEFNLTGEDFNKDTSTWTIKPKQGLTHTVVEEWFRKKEEGKSQSTHISESNSEYQQELTLTVSPEFAKTLKVISDTLNNENGKITIVIKK